MTTLPDSHARCHGVRSTQQCIDCDRRKHIIIDRERTDKFANIMYITPPQSAHGGKCVFFKGEKE